MPMVCGVQFRGVGKIYYFSPGDEGEPQEGDQVIVKTSRGREMGTVALPVHEVASLLEEEFTPQFFAKKILSFQQHKEKIDQMEKNLSALRKDSAAGDIVGLCFETMESSL